MFRTSPRRKWINRSPSWCSVSSCSWFRGFSNKAKKACLTYFFALFQHSAFLTNVIVLDANTRAMISNIGILFTLLLQLSIVKLFIPQLLAWWFFRSIGKGRFLVVFIAVIAQRKRSVRHPVECFNVLPRQTIVIRVHWRYTIYQYPITQSIIRPFLSIVPVVVFVVLVDLVI